jgi:hypothetical protein
MINRRNLLKTISLSLGASMVSTDVFAQLSENTYSYEIAENPLHQPTEKPITVITCGAGSRGNVYGDYALQFPAQMKIIGVAEPVEFRKE